MLSSTLAAAGAVLFATAASASPFSLPNGFPNPSASALKQIQINAGGTLPNTPLPTSLKADAITSLQVIAVNEIFEVSYFSSLLKNITDGVKGYTNVPNSDYIKASLKAIIAQEELHAIGANAILKSAGAKTISPCNYMYPVDNYNDAIALASTFTDVVLGTLQSVAQGFALDGGQAAKGLVPLLASIIGQEGEQDGAYRMIQKKVPSAAPFLTASAGEFAFNAIGQTFIVPGSCDAVLKEIGLPVFKTLGVSSSGNKPTNKDETITMTTSYVNAAAGSNYIAYISGQNSPVVVPITSVSKGSKSTTFKVEFPFSSKGFSKGLTIAALVKSKGPFSSAADVAKATVAGPGLIEVD